MTIITQISDKKFDKQKEPLVIDDNVSVNSSTPSGDVESNGGAPLVVSMRANRVNSMTTFCVFLTALFVLTTGIIGGVYLYRQFAHYRMKHFRGWCNIPYMEQSKGYEEFHRIHSSKPNTIEALTNNEDSNTMNEMINDITAHLKKNIDDELIADGSDENILKRFNTYFEEEFDIDIEYKQYERIDVPDFSHGRRGRFIHDFSMNKTGIIDIEEGRCFVMPLNRTMVIPPENLYDLVIKMRSGYYDIDTQVVREMFRVVTPPVEDFKSLGYYIARECAKMPTYMLEKIVNGVFKRSISTDNHKNVVFSEFAGNKISEIEIVNLHVAKGNK